MQINFQRLTETAKMPVQAHPTDAGIDFFYDGPDCFIPIGNSNKIITLPTGIRWEPYRPFTIKSIDPNAPLYSQSCIEERPYNDYNIYLKLYDKSGFSTKTGLVLIAGVIDEDYVGEIIACFQCLNSTTVTIESGMKICQGIVCVTPKIELVEVTNIQTDTDRGEAGFGSTGV